MTAWSLVARLGPQDALLIVADPLLRSEVDKNSLICLTFLRITVIMHLHLQVEETQYKRGF